MVVERISVVSITGVRSGEASTREDRVAVEEPLEIRVGGVALAVVMRTPGHDAELAAGLLASEGVIARSSDLLAIAHCTREAEGENIIEVHLTPEAESGAALKNAQRSLLTSSSCGVCGKRSIESLHTTARPFDEAEKIDPDRILALPARLQAAQAVFAETGGLHAAAIFDRDGTLIAAREDVGRHNAVDKCIGRLLLSDRLPLAHASLMVSGRVSFEIVQKALVARIPLIAAVSAPTSLAVELARASNLALCGFVRGQSFNVYAGAL